MNELASPPLADRPTGTSDPDEFQLPVSGLFADMELGRGSLQLHDDFKRSSGLVKLQLLRDWQRSLTRYRQAAIQQFEQELSRGAPGMDREQRLNLLRSTCESLRIELPSEFGRHQMRT